MIWDYAAGSLIVFVVMLGILKALTPAKLKDMYPGSEMHDAWVAQYKYAQQNNGIYFVRTIPDSEHMFYVFCDKQLMFQMYHMADDTTDWVVSGYHEGFCNQIVTEFHADTVFKAQEIVTGMLA